MSGKFMTATPSGAPAPIPDDEADLYVLDTVTPGGRGDLPTRKSYSTPDDQPYRTMNAPLAFTQTPGSDQH